MKQHYDIGLVGCWYWGNYGSLLNGYATSQLLEQKGLSTLKIVTPNNGFEPHTKKFLEVAYEKEDISPALNFDQVDQYNDLCDTFVTGSDQIWHYRPQIDNRKYDNYFRLDFADDEKRKVSFATSFGRYVPEPEALHREFKKLMERYNDISVREQEGVNILKKSYGLEATQVLEPVLCLDKSYWYELAEHSEYHEPEQYLLTYILDPTPEKRKAIQYYSEKLGMKTINILDGFSGSYHTNRKRLNLPNTLPTIWCADFLNYFSHAYYVITDSFHGVCFSAIFHKPFLAIGNELRGLKRFETLLNMIDMRERLVSDKNIRLDEKYLYHVDYNDANKILQQESERTVKWLDEAVNRPVEKKVQKIKKHVNTLLDQEECMGCGACVSVCPSDAITIIGDQYGVYRAKVDTQKCIDCGKCQNVCAALNLPKNLNSSNPTSYAFISSDMNTRMESSSGGAFTALAKAVLKNNGTVVGAAWTEDFFVKHMMIEKEEDLPKLQKSKYFQSYTGSIYKDIKAVLQTGKEVLFCGTPCQVAGLKKYLGQNYNNMFLIDLLCANCPSAAIFKKYLDENYSMDTLQHYDFRYKSENEKLWNAKKVRVTINDQVQIKSIEEDDYLQVYHTCSLGLSSQCLTCHYQGNTRMGDLTIGDCWGIQTFDKTVDVTKGVTAVLVNNRQGEDLLKRVAKEDIGLLKEEPLDQIRKYNVLAFMEKRHWPHTLRRETFLSEILKGSFADAKDKAIVLPNRSAKVKSDISRTLLKNLIPTKVEGILVKPFSGNSMILSWKKNANAAGYVIEQRKEGNWERIARIGHRNETSFFIENVEKNVTYQFRIMTFVFDHYTALPLYSEYEEFTGKIE